MVKLIFTLQWRIQDLILGVGGVDFVNGVGVGGRKSLNVLKVEIDTSHF